MATKVKRDKFQKDGKTPRCQAMVSVRSYIAERQCHFSATQDGMKHCKVHSNAAKMARKVKAAAYVVTKLEAQLKAAKKELAKERGK